MPKVVRDLVLLMSEAESLGLKCKDALGGVELRFENVSIHSSLIFNLSTTSFAQHNIKPKITAVKVFVDHEEKHVPGVIKIVSLKFVLSFWKSSVYVFFFA